MKLFICSDFHLEFLHPIDQIKLIENLINADAIVLAGDISTKKFIVKNIKQLCDKYNHVIFVAGNHEYYGSSFEEITTLLLNIKRDNFYWLDNSEVTIEGQHFVGGTLWFDDHDNLNVLYEKYMNDFFYIKDFKKHVYEKNKESIFYFKEKITEDSVVVTHHLPSWKSVHKNYQYDNLNRFFVCDIESIIYAKQPKLFIHGHSHNSVRYKIDGTEIICNPLGYINEKNKEFKYDLIVEV